MYLSNKDFGAQYIIIALSELLKNFESLPATRPAHRSSLPILPNLLNRRFSTEQTTPVWVSNITQMRCQEGWLYLAVIMDLGTRQIVGHAMGPINSSALVLKALRQAWGRQKPNGDELLFHSDQGVQYRSETVMQWLNDRGVTISMSCWGNTCTESFFASLKKEWGVLPRNELRAEIRYYLDVYYPHMKRHEALGNITPIA